MRKILSYNISDSELMAKAHRCLEYSLNKTLLLIKNNDLQLNHLDLTVKNGLFNAKYSATFSNGELRFKPQMTFGKFLWLILAILQSVVSALFTVTGTQMLLNPERNSNIYDVLIPLFFIAVAFIVWLIYRRFYITLPSSIISAYFYNVILNEPQIEEATIYEVDDYASKDESYIDKDEFDEPDPTPSWEVHHNRRKSFCTIAIASLSFFFFLGAGIVASNSIVATILLFGISLLLLGFSYIATLLFNKKAEQLIAQKSAPYEGTVIDITLTDDKNFQKVFQFEDAFGAVHKATSLKTYEIIRHDNPEDLIGAKTRIWYAPDYHSNVLEAQERPTSTITIKDKSLLSGVCFLLIGCLILIFAGQTQLDKGELDPIGASLKIEWTDNYEPTGLTQEDVDSDTVQWLCATYALRLGTDGGELGVIGFFEPTDENCEHVKEYLDDTWGISDRDSAIRVFDNLLERGHRAKYKLFLEELKEDGWLDCTEEEFYGRLRTTDIDGKEYRYEGAYHAYHAFGEHGIDAWDYCRVIRVAHLCYVAEYITLEECLDQSLPIAKQLQQEYDSWEELNASYIYGYQYWIEGKEKGQLVIYRWEQQAQNITRDKDGPYSYDFDMELVDTWN